MSSIYNHPNISTGSGINSGGTYRYRDDSIGQTSAVGVNRSSSRAAAVALQAGMPTRVTSQSYRAPQSNSIASGAVPPRRPSRRVPEGQLPLSGSSYGLEGGTISSTEDWKDRGAAIRVQQDVDANGKPISRVVKKGIQDFQLGRTLGEGSYSTVFAATDRSSGREFAIKVLDKRHIIKEKKVKYVNIERDTLNRLTEHPGVVRLYFTFQDERSLYFVLGMANGGELLGFLKKTGTFNEECTRFYGAQILDTIDYIHTRGVIHRDLKPENVLLDEQMHVKITDFGTAKLLDMKKPYGGTGVTSGDPLDGADIDRAVSFVGTAEYVSPELLTEKNACKASDLWAFGCMIYQLLTGRPPFKAANEYLTFQKIVGLDYTFPEGFPPLARDLVERLLVLDPARRLPIEHIKNHQFFDGINWGIGLWKERAPQLKPYNPSAPDVFQTQSGIISGGLFSRASAVQPHATAGPSTISPAVSSAPLRPHAPARLITELPPPSQLDIEWSPVLTKTNERILKLGNLTVTSSAGPHSPTGKTAESETPKKFSRFFGGSSQKKRQRLVMVTSSARVVLVPAGGEEKKMKQEVSLLTPGTTYKKYQDARGLTCWCVETRDKHIVFEDPKATTSDPDGSAFSCQEWMDVIERAKEFAMQQHNANSYSVESFNDMGSVISSPSGSLGADAALEGVDVPRNRYLLKDHGDNDSVKKKNRFSKRVSKNGLAAVF
ncbi:kinase-like protein [Pseudovirgaria hyperparasitica]|uniref:non-specific serine/threonine protein kinase n=1 Tax=Pseudovirgaria hyperparasitica TaxID=470096 RepID=A0A6A6W7E9_9PEZI|nr:kinase-like protein [Pseudovirgaria hyperparasitica]KAF2757806.1 kinase-like protein [Pseudovirgaria hyperparasitica]